MHLKDDLSGSQNDYTTLGQNDHGMVDYPNNARYFQAVKSVPSVKEGKELFTVE